MSSHVKSSHADSEGRGGQSNGSGHDSQSELGSSRLSWSWWDWLGWLWWEWQVQLEVSAAEEVSHHIFLVLGEPQVSAHGDSLLWDEHQSDSISNVSSCSHFHSSEVDSVSLGACGGLGVDDLPWGWCLESWQECVAKDFNTLLSVIEAVETSLH